MNFNYPGNLIGVRPTGDLFSLAPHEVEYFINEIGADAYLSLAQNTK